MPSPLRFDPTDAAGTSNVAAAVAGALRDGRVVLVPTDTVYGLMCSPVHPGAAAAIYAMKQRPSEQRLPIIVADAEQAETLPFEWNASARILARRFWPGALTIACGVGNPTVDWLAGRDEAAMRAPAHELIQRLARELGPLLMTSANRHGGGASGSVEQARCGLAGEPAVVVDGGILPGTSSTLVNTNLPVPVIEREGAIARAAIEEVITVE